MIYHGSPPSQIHYVNFDIESMPVVIYTPTSCQLYLIDDESLVGVFGRAGFQSSYSRNLINSIGFVIFDAKHATTRIVGVCSPIFPYMNID